MSLRRTVLFGMWLILGLNLFLAFGAIGVLMRMRPVIADILAKNENSMEACETMLAALASPTIPDGTSNRVIFEEGLSRAFANVTEPDEMELLDRISESTQDNLPTDAEQRTLLIDDIRTLAAINRGAMISADEEAQQLGIAGAWAVVFLAVLSFGAGLILVRRVDRVVFDPLEEIRQTLNAARSGDPFRRCTTVAAPSDLRLIMEQINGLLDHLEPKESGRDPSVGT